MLGPETEAGKERRSPCSQRSRAGGRKAGEQGDTSRVRARTAPGPPRRDLWMDTGRKQEDGYMDLGRGQQWVEDLRQIGARNLFSTREMILVSRLQAPSRRQTLDLGPWKVVESFLLSGMPCRSHLTFTAWCLQQWAFGPVQCPVLTCPCTLVSVRAMSAEVNAMCPDTIFFFTTGGGHRPCHCPQSPGLRTQSPGALRLDPRLLRFCSTAWA